MKDVPLPEPTGDIRLPGAFGLACDGYTAEQLRSYGAACVAAERERCARACEQVAWTNPNSAHLGPELNAMKCVKAIRAGLDAARPAESETPAAGGA
jgi:uncharacterized protein with von Willebrand factor type A (vWA) domain